MGNEASQEGGEGGPAGPGGPPRPGGMMGPPQQSQVRPSMGPPTVGSLMGVMTRGPRPAAPQQQQQTRPIAQYPAGPDSVPRGQRPGPIQVGVQPWADPPVQQPYRQQAPYRGAAPQQHQQTIRPGPTGPQQHQTRASTQHQKLQITQKQQQQASEELGVDLSDLSEEEKAKILSVMAKAHDMEEDLERHKRAKEPEVIPGVEIRRPQLLCPGCRAVDLAVDVNKMCGDCGINYCQKCGTFVPGEGRRSVWVCNDCSVKRKEHSAAMAAARQQQEASSAGATYTMAGQKMMDPSRRDDPMSRVGQTYQQPVQQQQQQQQQQQMVYQSGMTTNGYGMPMHTMDHQSTSLISGASVTSSSSAFASGSLLSGAVNSSGQSIPGTVPVMTLSQPLQQQDQVQQMWAQSNQQQLQQAQQMQPMQQWNMQQGITSMQPTMLNQMQTQHQQGSPKLKPKGIELASGSLVQPPQKLKGQKGKQEQRQLTATEWSPVADLSPIMDVSPSLEAAEQELMEKCQGDPNRPSIPRATSGTISGMLADFNRALGLATTPVDDMSGVMGPHLHPDNNNTMLSATNMKLPQISLSATPTSQSATGVIVTDVDQNQNLVQQQFQLQQQQMMIQQQQQMIQQQQQQLQQQAQIQQQLQLQQQQKPIQMQQPLTQQTIQHQSLQQQQQQPQQQQLMQQQQPFQQQSTIGQQGVMVGAAIQSQQQARKVHGSLPHPTTEQMQAAVAIAAQTPRGKPRALGAAPTQRPVSPMMPRKGGTTDANQLRYGSGGGGAMLLGAPTGQYPTGLSPTPLTTSLSAAPISPTPLHRVETDTISEPDAGKSGKIGRRLPPVPLDQEPTTVPRRTKDRTRTLSMGATPLGWDRRTPHRTTSLDGGMALTTGLSTTTTSASGFDYTSLISATSTTDSYLKYLTASTLSSGVDVTTSSILSAIGNYGMGSNTATSMVGRRDLSAPHSLSSYLRTSGVGIGPPSSFSAIHLLDHSITPDPLLSTSLDSALGGSKLPSYMMSLKHQLREGLRSVSEDRRRITDPDITSGLLSHSSWLQDPLYDPLRRVSHTSAPSSILPLASSGRAIAPSTGQGSPRRSRHKRHSSDTKLYSSTWRDDFVDDPLSRYKFPQYSTSTMPFKSFEFESIDDHLRMGGLLRGAYRPTLDGSLLRGASGTYPRRSSVRDDLDTRFKTQDQMKRYNRQLARLRRHTDTGLSSLSSLGMGLDPYGRSNMNYSSYNRSSSNRRAMRQQPPGLLRRPRSWHPSPYVSEDEEEDQREERKAKIKAEIARRRLQMEERLQDELYKLARVREGTDRGYVVSPAFSLSGDRMYSSPISLDSGSSPRSQSSDPQSVLQAIDDLLRKDVYGRRDPSAAYGSVYTTAPSAIYATDRHHVGLHRGGGTRYDRYYDPYYDGADDIIGGGRIGSTFVDEMDLYDPSLDYSPMGSETPTPPMPLLPDMPTRSRKILEDLGSSPIVSTSTARRSAGRSVHPYDDYVDQRHDDRPLRQHHQQHHQDSSHHLHHHQSVERPPVASGNRSRKPQNSKASQKYDFPVKRILLTRDPKDRSVSGNGLGMKVVGGKEIPGSQGMIGAYVARIYPGGVVETLGEVREGDQVLEWNGISLTGKTYEEVQRIIASSGDEVEIVIRSDFNMLSSRSLTNHQNSNDRHHNQHHRHHSPSSRLREGPPDGSKSSRDHTGSRSTYTQNGGRGETHQSRHSERHGGESGYNRNYDTAEFLQSPTDEGVHNSNYYAYNESERNGYTSPSHGYSTRAPHSVKRSPSGSKSDFSESNKERYKAENISGEIQLQICFDSKAAILYVTIVRARNLVTSRDNSGLPDPFVKCYLLPDRCVENERRTRYFSRCSDPEWKQTMVYPNVPQDQLKKHYLEISVWNYDINRPSEFLGEVILDLKDTSVIDEQSRWYKLHPHDPKKYPGGSFQVPLSALNNEGNMKMARLNNPGQKSLYFDGGEDVRKISNEKKFFKQLLKKSTTSENYTRDSEQPALEDANSVLWKSDGSPSSLSGVPWRHLQCALAVGQWGLRNTRTLLLPDIRFTKLIAARQ